MSTTRDAKIPSKRESLSLIIATAPCPTLPRPAPPYRALPRPDPLQSMTDGKRPESPIKRAIFQDHDEVLANLAPVSSRVRKLSLHRGNGIR